VSGLGYLDTQTVSGVTGWETETMCGESVYRAGAGRVAEIHRGWGQRELAVAVGPLGWRLREWEECRTLSLSVEEAELLALALTEAVLRATEELEEVELCEIGD
jgi:hypothetical protein